MPSYLPILSLGFGSLIVTAIFILSFKQKKIHYIWVLITLVVFIGMGVAPVSISLKRGIDVQLQVVTNIYEKQLEAKSEVIQALQQEDSLRAALQHIVNERRAQWDGSFEREYVSLSVFFTSQFGTKAYPLKVHDLILRWRGGLSGEKGLLFGFLGGTHSFLEQSPPSGGEVAKALEKY